jgi:hypothetical protein
MKRNLFIVFTYAVLFANLVTVATANHKTNHMPRNVQLHTRLYVHSDSCVVNLPFSENFDTTNPGSIVNPNAPDCWSFLNNFNGLTYVENSNNSASQPNAYRLADNWEGSGTFMLISPFIQELASNGMQVKFKWRGINGLTLEVGTINYNNSGADGFFDTSTFQLIKTITSTTGAYQDVEVDILPGTNNYFVVKHGNTSTFQASYYLDDFEFLPLPDCLKPRELSALDITNNSASINWLPVTTETNGYEWILMDANSPPSSEAALQTGSVNSGDNTALLSNLNGNTTYYFYLRTVCSNNETSEWSDPFILTTLCDPYQLPFSEDFEGLGVSTPPCWSVINTGAGNANTSCCSETNAQSGVASFVLFNAFYTTDDYLLISPQIQELNNLGVKLNFSAKGPINGRLQVGTIQDPNNPNTFQLLETIMLTANDIYQDFEVYIFPNSNNYIAVRHAVDFSNQYFYLDDFYFDVLPDCFKPNQPVIDQITQTTAVAEWNDTFNDSSAYYEYILVAAGKTPNQNNAVLNQVISETSISLNNLLPNTKYDLYVRTLCGEHNSESNTFSDWSIKAVFTTLRDNNIPQIQLQNIEIQLDENGEATLVPELSDNGSTDDCNCQLEFSANPKPFVYTFGFEDWYVNSQFDNNYSYTSFYRYTFNNETNTLSSPYWMFFVDQFDNLIDGGGGYWPIAYDRNPVNGTDYFIIDDGPRYLFTYNMQNYSGDYTGVSFSQNISDFTFDINGIAYAWIGNNIHVLDLQNGTSTVFVSVTQAGGGKGLTYDYDTHNLILASGGNSESQFIIGKVDIDTGQYLQLGTIQAPESTFNINSFSTLQGIEYVGQNKCLVSGGWWNYDFGVLDLNNLTIQYTSENNYLLNSEQPGFKDIFVPIDVDIFAESNHLFNCSDIGDNLIEVYVYDPSGNENKQMITVDVVDRIAPVPDLETLPDIDSQCAVTTLEAPAATDNCSDNIMVLSDAVFPITTSTSITWTYEDESGNTSMQSQNIVINDTTAPLCVTQDITIELDEFGFAAITANDIDNGSTDNCEIAQISVTPNTFTLIDIGQVEVILTVTDASNNTSRCSAIVTVLDNPLNMAVFEKSDVKISPNPFNHSISIKLPLSYNLQPFHLKLYTLRGKLVMDKRIIAENGQLFLDNLGSLDQSVYFLHIANGNGTLNLWQQLIKQ